MPSDLMCSGLSRSTRLNGFSLMECLVVVALLGILATLAIPSSSAVQRRLDLDSGLRRLRVGLDRGRMAAERDRQPCSLQLTASGWQLPLQAAQQLLSPAVARRHGFILPRFGRQCICLRPTCS